MAIRMARLDDIPGLVLMGREVHATTRFRGLGYDADRVARSLDAALTRGRDRHVCLVAEGGDGRIVGLLLGVLERHIFTDRLTASVMLYAVLPERRMGGHGLRLMRAFEHWARNRGVAEIAFGINSGAGHEVVGAFARKLGFVRVGENFVKEMG